MKCRGDSRQALAYLEGELSAARRARFDVHLSACGACRTTLSRVREAHRAIRRAADLKVTSAASSSIEARIAWGIAPSRRRAAWPVLAVVSVALAAAAVLLITRIDWVPSRELTTTRAPSVPAEKSAPAPSVLPVLIEKSATLLRDNVGRPLAPSDVLRPGDVVVAGGRVVIQSGHGTGCELSNARVQIVALSQAAQELEVQSGRATCIVSRRRPAERFSVHAGDHVVNVRGTLFSVACMPGRTEIELASGAVEVFHARKKTRGLRLTAPTRALLADGTLVAEKESPPAEVNLEPPRLLSHFDALLATLDATGELHVSSHPAGASVVVDGALLGQTPVVLRLDRGERRVTLDIGGVAVYRETVVIGERPARVTHTVQRRPKSTERDAQVSERLGEQRADVTRCYERALKGQPGLRGTAELRIRVAESGRVTRARVRARGIPEALGRCIERIARSWHFGDGDEAWVVVPVRFQAK